MATRESYWLFHILFQDPKATQTLPLPGHSIKVVGELGERQNVFALMHKDIIVSHFQTDSEEDLQQ